MARTTRSSTAKAQAGSIVGQQQLSSPPPTPARTKKEPSKSTLPRKGKQSRGSELPSTPATKLKRSRTAIKQEEGDINELPHNLGTTLPTPGVEDDADIDEQPQKKRAKKSSIKIEGVKYELESAASPWTPKKVNYGLTPGISPYPDYERPTIEECYEVQRLLETVHGKVIAPKAIPPPSLDVAGCGEVPSVLDALIRTRLSAATTGKNSSTAFQGLVSRFGTVKEGIGKGSVDWDAVRQAPLQEIFNAIRSGGLAGQKSKDIQIILEMAYKENQERQAALLDSSKNLAGAEDEKEIKKQGEVAKATQNIISLDHLHLLSTEDAITEMTKFPGIGVKTASCVALFCLQRPSFAVDTHVFRLCTYLGWVPKTAKKGQPKVDRNTAFSHCEVRVPDELKYPLHQLFIRHGKVCPRCRAATGQNSANWKDGCPIEHLVKRHGAKKGGISVADRKKAQAAANKKGGDKEEDDDVSSIDDTSELNEDGADDDEAEAAV